MKVPNVLRINIVIFITFAEALKNIMKVKYASLAADKAKEMNAFILFSEFLEECEGYT